MVAEKSFCGGWYNSRIESLQVLSTLDFGLWILDLDLDCDNYYLLLVQVTRDMLTESVAIVPGFTSYFAFSRLRSGYSGVATFCRTSATPAQSDSSLAQASMIV